MAGHKKRSPGAGAIRRAAMKKNPPGLRRGAKMRVGAGPKTAGQHHAVAKRAQAKASALTPDPGALLGKLARPTAAPKKKRSK